MTDEPDHDWLAWSLRDARKKVAAWPEWKREAFRVLPEIDAPERRDGGEMSVETKFCEECRGYGIGHAPGGGEIHALRVKLRATMGER